jgi:hypothetical protein
VEFGWQKMAFTSPSPNIWRIPWHLTLIFALLAAGILSLGFFFYQYQVTFFQNISAADRKSYTSTTFRQAVK